MEIWFQLEPLSTLFLAPGVYAPSSTSVRTPCDTGAVAACCCSGAGGCTFDEDSDASLCDYRQGQEDDFDWQLIRTYSWPHATPDLLRGECAHLHLPVMGKHSPCERYPAPHFT
ncbi:unnamed protein product [Boreogadus saida]